MPVVVFDDKDLDRFIVRHSEKNMMRKSAQIRSPYTRHLFRKGPGSGCHHFDETA
jgi:hypothetical protein